MSVFFCQCHFSNIIISRLFYCVYVCMMCLQCFDAVGWAAGRASGLYRTEWWGAGMVICLERGADLHMVQLCVLWVAQPAYVSASVWCKDEHSLVWLSADVCLCDCVCGSLRRRLNPRLSLVASSSLLQVSLWWVAMGHFIFCWDRSPKLSSKTKVQDPINMQNVLNHVSDRLSHLTSTYTRLTALSPGPPRWAGTRKAKPIWILLKQETVSGSGISWNICKSAPRSRQITTPTPHHSVFYRPDALPATQPTASKHWRQSM